jgi:hypothetical protein
VLDLFAEHRVETNGIKLPCGNGLIGALAIRGLAHIDAGEKDEMRRKFMEQDTWSPSERPEGINYCMTDVIALAALLLSHADRAILCPATWSVWCGGGTDGMGGNPD